MLSFLMRSQPLALPPRPLATLHTTSAKALKTPLSCTSERSKVRSSMGSRNTRHLVSLHQQHPSFTSLIFPFSSFSTRTGIVWEVLVDNKDRSTSHCPSISHRCYSSIRAVGRNREGTAPKRRVCTPYPQRPYLSSQRGLSVTQGNEEERQRGDGEGCEVVLGDESGIYMLTSLFLIFQKCRIFLLRCRHWI